ncbi:hypothetical protein ACFU96_44235 [Streptomyces sp. NPDC057620]|uniref:hypothetical protein n=1 Tax=Streptomyces sp. NPDC057620 TaxID=3346185 RepID=UPI0036907982
MTDTTTEPKTPADVAAAVLDAIEANPDAFSMSDWCRLPGNVPLPPHVIPPRGAALCVAAWAAHLTGWTLVESANLVKVTVRLAEGQDVQGHAFAYAHKGGEDREIASVADVALGLEPGHRLWVTTSDPDAAFECLRQIAGR